MTETDPRLCDYCHLFMTTGWGGPGCCETCDRYAPDLTECTCPTTETEGAP